MFEFAASLKGCVLVMQHTEFVVYNLDIFTALNHTLIAPDPHNEKKYSTKGKENSNKYFAMENGALCSTYTESQHFHAL